MSPLNHKSTSNSKPYLYVAKNLSIKSWRVLQKYNIKNNNNNNKMFTCRLKLKFFLFGVAVGLGALALADGHVALEISPVGMWQPKDRN